MPDKIDQHLGMRIAEARQSAGLSEESAADLLAISVPAYRSLERGEKRINAFSLATLSQAYGPPIRWFYQGLPGQSVLDQTSSGRSV